MAVTSDTERSFKLVSFASHQALAVLMAFDEHNSLSTVEKRMVKMIQRTWPDVRDITVWSFKLRRKFKF